MSWAKFDDRYDDHEKIKRVWKRSGLGAALHCHAITYSARHETDGMVTTEWIQERFDIARTKPKDRTEAMAALVELGLFELVDGERFLVHDYLDYNPSAAELQAKREADAERKRKKPPSGLRADSNGSPSGNGGSVHSDSEPRAGVVPARPGPAPPGTTEGQA
jgi:hypothetical protein